MLNFQTFSVVYTTYKLGQFWQALNLCQVQLWASSVTVLDFQELQ